MDKKIDVRILKLNKWYVPKSVELSELEEPVALGYFDALEVIGLDEEQKNDIAFEKVHPLTAGYQKLAELKIKQKEKLVDYTSQEQMLFLNIGDGDDGTEFMEDEVRAFWDNKDGTLPYRYLSMIHIAQNDKLSQTLKWIKEVFKKDYLSYISFDFCDIVLFARNMTIHTFLSKIKELFAVQKGTEALIFDTFSMVSFWSSYVNDFKSAVIEAKNDEFQATINISVRNYQKFKQWFQSRDSDELVCYDIYGRHDVSIVNNKANTGWLMDIMRELHDKNNQDIFWTFETFLKIEQNDAMNMTSPDSNSIEKLYQYIQTSLNEKISKFALALEKLDIYSKDRYMMPLYEVRDCICSIVKNNFAEEFIYCVYESFLHFISYMEKEAKDISESVNESHDIKQENPNKYITWQKAVAKCYDRYFVAMTILVNSIMHNERNFVQTTAFSAVFYFVPPKIMAFYNAYIYSIKKILLDENSANQYTFLIYPSFSSAISLEQISLQDEPPCDRILTVTVSENSLYDIEAVMYQMVHEIAHYVGSNLRCRKMRTQRIIASLLKWIISKCEMDDEICRMLQDYFKESVENFFDASKGNYLQYLFKIGKRIYQILESADVCNIFEAYYQTRAKDDEAFQDELLDCFGMKEKQQKLYIENYGRQYANVKFLDFKSRLHKLKQPGVQREYQRYMEVIKSVYRECYADLQMILVLAMDAEDYLNSFILDKEMSIEDVLCSTEDMIRIATVFRVMMDSGLWQKPMAQDNEGYRIVFSYIDEYNQKIKEYLKEIKTPGSCGKEDDIQIYVKKFNFENGIKLKGYLTKEHIASIKRNKGITAMKPLVDIIEELYEYLLEVLINSLIEYSKSDKANQIEHVRERINIILNFKDITEIFSCIEEELSIYKKDGCGIVIDK